MTRWELARRLSPAVVSLIFGLIAVDGTQAATVTVGSPLTAPNAANFAGTATEANFTLAEPGAHATSPVNGTIVSYQIDVYPTNSGRFAIRVLRPAAGGQFSGAGTGAPVTPAGSGLQSFGANLPIHAGDLVGLDLVDGTSEIQQESSSDSTIYEWGNPGFLADGQTAAPANTYANAELGFNAQVAPTNTITVGSTQRNKKKGSATLNLTLPNPGDLIASGNGVNVASAGGAVISKSVGAGAAQLVVKAKGKKKKTLQRTGKVKISVGITYTPSFGDPNTQSVKVKLKKKV